ncbi:electron transfer flavoprotein subunit alpha/FixB family protein [Photobacterium alginatilyticum]|uniref:Electron transfer flavoprotein subunit alpha/FixB family protein n=1 Tax=Photobacterium alginatilyticum TaxID=1775171 RepID=A0ABW9YHY7_9GAMM|nr:electron transfer flavoprotein subunit alpha/FixB family protein [Photobacterium alginatilyticum]NBI53378.1 electron transfer flavoprotein subunit alpha/FixB family protein [Photobacterium alginatilyticum]
MSKVFRRDPRQERIQRNRLHPLHHTFEAQHLANQSQASVVSSGANSETSLETSSETIPTIEPQGWDTSRLPLHRVEHPEFYIAVVPEMSGGRLTSADRDMLGLAQQLANDGFTHDRMDGQKINGRGAVLAVVFCSIKDDRFADAGVDRLLDLSLFGEEGYQPEYQLALLLQADKQFSPRYWLFGDQAMNSADLGRRLAARLDERAATGVVEIDDNWIWCRAGQSGNEYRRPHERIMLVAEQIAEPVCNYRYQASPVELDVLMREVAAPEMTPPVLTKIEDLGLAAVDPGSVSLAEAEFVVAGGNGVMNWPLFHQVATALGATEGASRVAVDDGNMPRSTQVGASGILVSARVYLAVGISGAIQHLQGMTHCDTVIAINLDSGCAMVSRADLSVIGDSSEIMQALVDSISHRESESQAGELTGFDREQAKEKWDDAV